MMMNKSILSFIFLALSMFQRDLTDQSDSKRLMKGKITPQFVIRGRQTNFSPKMQLIFLLFPTLISAHGMLFAPNDVNSDTAGTVRGISKLNTNIDGLRSPTVSSNTCRSEGKSKAVPIELKNGQDLTVTLAISQGAEHIGDCYLYVLNENLEDSVLIGESTDSKACAFTGGECQRPADSVTNDMCLVKWTVKVQNAEKIKCTDCVLQWKWVAKHVPATEYFENCADLQVAVANDSQSAKEDEEQEEAQKKAPELNRRPLRKEMQKAPVETKTRQTVGPAVKPACKATY